MPTHFRLSARSRTRRSRRNPRVVRLTVIAAVHAAATIRTDGRDPAGMIGPPIGPSSNVMRLEIRPSVARGPQLMNTRACGMVFRYANAL